MRKGTVIMWACDNAIEKSQMDEALTFATNRVQRAFGLCCWRPHTEKPVGWYLVFTDLSPETSNLYQVLYWWLMGYGDRISVERNEAVRRKV